MDDIVKQALAKWPNVPAVYGWLSLDRRGVWRIKGDAVTNPVISAFISRNYDHDERGRWFFQNGPQRVYAALDYTPLVYHIEWEADPAAPLRIAAHTGAAVREIESAWVDENGVLLIVGPPGAGLLDDRHLERLLPCLCDDAGGALDEDAVAARIEALQAGGSGGLCLEFGGRRVPLRAVAAAGVAAKFGFDPQPLQPAGEEICN
jgi:hypothetical protein